MSVYLRTGLLVRYTETSMNALEGIGYLEAARTFFWISDTSNGVTTVLQTAHSLLSHTRWTLI